MSVVLFAIALFTVYSDVVSSHVEYKYTNFFYERSVLMKTMRLVLVTTVLSAFMKVPDLMN